MPGYIVTLKDDASEEKLAEVKQEIVDQGGKITQEYTLIKGFAVEVPEDLVQTFQGHEHVNIEEDSEVRTQ